MVGIPTLQNARKGLASPLPLLYKGVARTYIELHSTIHFLDYVVGKRWEARSALVVCR